MKKPCGLHLDGESLTMKFDIRCMHRKIHVRNIRTQLLNSPWSEELTSQQAEEITQWIEDNELGRRVAYDMWQLSSDDAVTMFMLRYG